MSARRSAAALASCLVLVGCESCPPVRGAWYLNQVSGNLDPVLVLLNEGPRPVELPEIVVNPAQPDGSAGWRFPRAVTLPPGRTTVLRFDEFRDAQGMALPTCHVPVAVALRCGDRSVAGWARLGGSLPSHLPEHWDRLCGPHDKGATQ